jgi:deoxyribonuclease V
MTARRGARAAAVRRRMTFPRLPDLAAELEIRVHQIPCGALATFGDLARSLGDRHAAVWVAGRLASHGPETDLPWHRVVRSTGELRGDATRLRAQVRQLRSEGHAVAQAGEALRVAIDRRFDAFRGRPPLDRLSRWLTRAAAHVQNTPLAIRPRIVAGVDVAYPSPDIAQVAAVAMDYQTGALLGSVTARLPVSFPYIPGYLTFRELPALVQGVQLLVEAGWRPDVVFVDGQGRMHPRRAGVATGLAAVIGASTVGVGKSLLHGRVERALPVGDVAAVRDGDELLGYAIGTAGSRKPIYVSVGGWVSLDQAVEWTQTLMSGRRLPKPIAEADRLSKRGTGPIDYGSIAPT